MRNSKVMKSWVLGASPRGVSLQFGRSGWQVDSRSTTTTYTTSSAYWHAIGARITGGGRTAISSASISFLTSQSATHISKDSSLPSAVSCTNNSLWYLLSPERPRKYVPRLRKQALYPLIPLRIEPSQCTQTSYIQFSSPPHRTVTPSRAFLPPFLLSSQPIPFLRSNPSLIPPHPAPPQCPPHTPQLRTVSAPTRWPDDSSLPCHRHPAQRGMSACFFSVCVAGGRC